MFENIQSEIDSISYEYEKKSAGLCGYHCIIGYLKIVRKCNFFISQKFLTKLISKISHKTHPPAHRAGIIDFLP